MLPRIKHRNTVGCLETKILKRALCAKVMRAVEGEKQEESASNGVSHITSVVLNGLNVQLSLGSVGVFEMAIHSYSFPFLSSRMVYDRESSKAQRSEDIETDKSVIVAEGTDAPDCETAPTGPRSYALPR